MATAEAATLDSILGIDVSIFDFIARNSAPETRRKVVRTVSRVRLDSDTLVELARNNDYGAVEEHVKQLFKKGDKQSYILLLKNYIDIQRAYGFSAGEMEDMVRALLKYDLLNYSERKEMPKSHSCGDYADVHPVRSAVSNEFVHSLLACCKNPRLIKGLAAAMYNTGYARDDGLIIRLYSSIGDEESLAECAAHVSLGNAAVAAKRITDNELRSRAIRSAIASKLCDSIDSLKSAFDHGFFGYALQEGHALDLERLVDATVKDGVTRMAEKCWLENTLKAYSMLRTSYALEQDITRIDGKLDAMLFGCVRSGDYESFEAILRSHAPKKDIRDAVLRLNDELFRKEVESGGIRLEDGSISGFKDRDHFYWWAGFGYQKSDRRAGDICLEMGKYDLAIAFYRKLQNNGQLIFDTALEIAKRGDTSKAFQIFEQINLNDIYENKVDTDKEEFYKIIGSAILSLFINKTELSPDEIKELFNRKIKFGLVHGISVASDDSGLEVKVDFGHRKVAYARQRVSGEYRNDVSLFTQSGISPRGSLLKFYADKKAAENEAYWLRRLEGKVPVKRLVSSETFGNLAFNQIEVCDGVTLADAHYSTLQDALAIAFNLYNAINPGRDSHAEHLSLDYIRQRVKEFGVDPKWIYSVLRDNEIGIIHNDFAPRNLMIKGKELTVVDHEVYVYGHPVGMAVTLVRNPENIITPSEAKSLIRQARRRYPASDEYVAAMSILWDCRQARWYEQGSEKREWYLHDMKEVMK